MKLITLLLCTFACIIFGSSCTVVYDPYFPVIYSSGCRSEIPVYRSYHSTYHYVPNTYCRPIYYHNSPYYK